jgi:hypothetical protein
VSYWGHFKCFAKIHEDIHNFVFIAGVNDTGDNLFTGINDAGDLLLLLSLVSLTPVIKPCSRFLWIPFVKKTLSKKFRVRGLPLNWHHRTAPLQSGCDIQHLIVRSIF